MAVDRRAMILAKLFENGSTHLSMARLCEVCTEVTGTTGAGVMLMSGDTPSGSLCTTNDVSARIEDLQYTLGEGPCIDAYRSNRPVLEADLSASVITRWLAFSLPAVAAGVGGIFGFPLRAGAVRIGALNLYRDRPGPMDDEQHANALVMADLIGETVIALQAKVPDGVMAPELEMSANFQTRVNQAAGMVSVQLGVSVFQALVRLRAYAFANSRLLTDVAQEVVSRQLQFERQPGETEDEAP